MIEQFVTDARPSLVGRRRESDALWKRFEAAATGQTGIVLIAGEPGIGKTRLLDTFAALATSSGACALRGGASEAAGMPPYLPFLEALGQHVRATPPDELRIQIGDMAGILASILPELAARLGDMPRSYPLPPEQERLRLFEAVSSFLAALANDRPLALIFDDLQWADGATLDLLAYFARRQRAIPLLVVGAYRAGDAEGRAAFAQTLAELNRLRALDLLTLEPLDADAMVALAESYLGGPVTAPLGEALFRHSEGNPFFAEELTAQLARRGRTQADRTRALDADGGAGSSAAIWDRRRGAPTPGAVATQKLLTCSGPPRFSAARSTARCWRRWWARMWKPSRNRCVRRRRPACSVALRLAHRARTRSAMTRYARASTTT